VILNVGDDLEATFASKFRTRLTHSS
jgi:hypothetical protein